MMTRLSVLLHDYRTTKALTQDEMASLLGISQQAYGKLESGVSLPRRGTLQQMAQVMGCSMVELNAAKAAQYEWNHTGLVTASVEEGGSGTPDGAMALVAKLSGALARGGLKPHQVVALNVMVDSYLVGPG
jgi:transcriptional regulator with XRE-family HTH domain